MPNASLADELNCDFRTQFEHLLNMLRDEAFSSSPSVHSTNAVPPTAASDPAAPEPYVDDPELGSKDTKVRTIARAKLVKKIKKEVKGAGNKMKERLSNAITLHAMQEFAQRTGEHDRESQPTEPGFSGSSKHPGVFISYAWESDELKKWVLEFAKRLRSHGIDVTLDRWNLGLGDNRLQSWKNPSPIPSSSS